MDKYPNSQSMCRHFHITIVTNAHSHNGDHKVTVISLHYDATSRMHCEVTVTDLFVICSSLQIGTYHLYNDLDTIYFPSHAMTTASKKLHYDHNTFTFTSHLQWSNQKEDKEERYHQIFRTIISLKFNRRKLF